MLVKWWSHKLNRVLSCWESLGAMSLLPPPPGPHSATSGKVHLKMGLLGGPGTRLWANTHIWLLSQPPLQKASTGLLCDLLPTSRSAVYCVPLRSLGPIASLSPLMWCDMHAWAKHRLLINDLQKRGVCLKCEIIIATINPFIKVMQLRGHVSEMCIK